MAANFKAKIAVIKADRDRALEKVAKLEGRLKAETERADESERELETIEKQIAMLEEDLDEAESRAKEMQHRAQQAEAEAEELEHRARRTSTLSGNDARRISAITAKYNVAMQRADESAETSRQLEAQVQQLEDDLVMAEEREAAARSANSDFESELRQLTENARSLGTQAKLSERESLLESRVQSLERKLADAEQRADRVTQLEVELERKVDEADEERDDWKERYRVITAEYEETMAELGEM